MTAAKARILIVEDEGSGAAELRAWLQTLGYPVCGPVAGGLRAIAEAAQARPDLALVDLGLAGEFTGPELAEQLGSRCDVPVVYLVDGSDGADGDRWQRAAAGNPYGCLVRPFGMRQLHLTIETAVASHARERAQRATEIRLQRDVDRLQDLNSLMKTVLDSMSEGVAAVDRNGVLLYHNPGALLLGGDGAPDRSVDTWLQEHDVLQADCKTPVAADGNPLLLALTGTATDDVELFVRDKRERQGVHLSVSGRPLRGDAGVDDRLDEADETFTMVLGDPANATLADGTAIGTIEDDDASVAQAWLARFARTVATHVVDAIGERVTEGTGQRSQATVAGRRLSPGAGAAQPDVLEPSPFRTMQFRELLAGSSFDLTVDRQDESGGRARTRWTVWGRGGVTGLAGREDELSIEGEVATGMVGADYRWGRMLAGLSAAYSGGGGEYAVSGTHDTPERAGDVGSWLLSVHPYVRLEMTDRLAAWGVLGYGRGMLELAEGGADVDTDISLTMGAFEGRGVLLSPGENGGVALAMKSDGFLVWIGSEAADDLPSTAAHVSRLRLVLEGSVDALRGPGGVLTPSLQVGARYDGGDAETGAGVEVGGGLRYAYPAWGLTVAANGRVLLAHQDRGLRGMGRRRLDSPESGRRRARVVRRPEHLLGSCVERRGATLVAGSGAAPGGRGGACRCRHDRPS